MLVMLLLLAVGAVSVWLLTLFHRGRTRELMAGLVTTMLILMLQYTVISDGWLSDPLRWMAGLAPSTGGSFEVKFFDDDHFPAWLANVALLATAAMAWTLWRLADRKRVDDARLPAWLRGKPLKRYYLGTLLTIAGAAILASHVIVAAWAAGSAWAEAIEPNLRGIFWSAPLVFCAMLYGAARSVTVTPRQPAPGPQKALLPPPPPRIAELLKYLRSDYQEHVIITEGASDERSGSPAGEGRLAGDPLLQSMHRRLRQDAGHASLRDEIGRDLADTFGDFWGDRSRRSDESPWIPWNVLLTEDLARAHLLLLIELMHSCHDRGGTVLVVAPAWSIGRMKRSIEAIGDADWSDITFRSHLLDEGPIDAMRQFNLIYTSDEALELGLLADRPEAAITRFLDLLELVVVFDFHLLEAAMLRLHLQRLRWVLERRQIPVAIRVVCQTENGATAQAAMRDTFEALGITQLKMAPPIIRRTNRHVVVWRGDTAALRALANNELKLIPGAGALEVSALTAIPPLYFDVRPGYLDSVGRWDSGIWTTTIPNLLNGQLQGHWKYRDVFLSLDRFPPADVRHLTVEDRGNLADALAQHRNFPGQDEYVLAIVAHRYPLRDWFLDILGHGGSLDNRMLPIAPAPRGGLTELAMVLAEEFRGSRPVSQSSLDDRFFNLVEPRTAEAFDLFPTPKGVSTLFRGETGKELNVESRTDAFHDITFSRRSGSSRPPVLVLTARRQGDSMPLFRVASGDHGLHYAEGTTLHSGGLPYRIDDVSAMQVVVGNAVAPIGRSRNAYLFHRQYCVNFVAEPACIALEGGPENPVDKGGGLFYWVLALRGAFERHTAARATIEETAPPFAPGQPTWVGANVHKNPRHAAMLLLRIELPADVGPELIAPDRHGAIAFTLAATMQDVLGSLFPPFAHRIAVVSPQATSCIEEVLNSSDPQGINRFPADFYPRLVAGFRRDAKTRRSNPPFDNQADIDGFLAKHGVSAPPSGTTRLHLLLIEDADHDLGVVRALFKDQHDTLSGRLFHVWSEFLRWLVVHQDDKDFYYRFGSPGLSSCFAFEEASAVVNVITKT